MRIQSRQWAGDGMIAPSDWVLARGWSGAQGHPARRERCVWCLPRIIGRSAGSGARVSDFAG